MNIAMTSSIGQLEFMLLNDLNKISPGAAMANMGQTFKNMVVLQILDEFLEAQGARIQANQFISYNAVGNIGAVASSSNVGGALLGIA